MIYVFDVYVLDPGRRELRRGSDRIEVEPQVFDLLEFLIRTRDRVASRDDILEAVWNGRIVSESTLSSRINAARTTSTKPLPKSLGMQLGGPSSAFLSICRCEFRT